MELNAEQIKNEIQSLIKALKDCGGWAERGNGEGWFNHEILADALALIKELTEENANLHASCTEFERKCASLNDENERLRGDCAKGANALIEEMQRNRTIKADTVRKMQARLEAACDAPYWCVWLSEIGEIAKEVLEDGK